MKGSRALPCLRYNLTFAPAGSGESIGASSSSKRVVGCAGCKATDGASQGAGQLVITLHLAHDCDDKIAIFHELDAALWPTPAGVGNVHSAFRNFR